MKSVADGFVFLDGSAYDTVQPPAIETAYTIPGVKEWPPESRPRRSNPLRREATRASVVHLHGPARPVKDHRPGSPKATSGIRGLDEITRGGLPNGRPTLVCGGPGSGKTLLALTFLVNGALQFDEPGVLMTFEENGEEIASDVASLGFDLPELVAAQKLAVDYVRVERSEIEETGEYDLEGLFVRLDYAIRTVGARARRPRHDRDRCLPA